MSIQCCSSCGKFVLPCDELWVVVDPRRPRPAEYLCAECEHTYETACEVFVFTDKRRHLVTLLSDRGLRVAQQEALRRRTA